MPCDTVALSSDGQGSEIARWTAQVLADGLYLGLSECSHLEVLRPGGGEGPGACHLALTVTCARVGDDRMAIRIALVEGRTGRQLWAGHSIASMRGGPPVEDLDVLRLTNRAVEAAALDRRVVRDTPDRDRADQLLRMAIDKIFSMQPAEVAAADDLLVTANELRPSPIYLAWRLQIRTIQRLERHRQDERTLREEAAALAAHVLEAGESNSMILALLANANLFLFRDPAASLHFGVRSMDLNPANAMAAWALSSARLYNDDALGAYAAAVRGRRMAQHSTRRFFWDLQLAASAMVLGRREEAIGLLEGITFDRPTFRPPLRYLVALDATRGREERALKYVRRLKSFEPDFSTARLFGDPNYPASLVHRTNLIEADRVLPLR